MARKSVARVGAVVLSVLAATAAERKASGEAMTLTPLDYIEIRQLVSRYAFAVDTGSNNGYDYADLFAADGEFMRPYAKGREQLAALARGDRLGPNNTVHYIMNHVIEPTADGAIGREYLVELNWDIAPSGDSSRRSGPVNQWDLIGRKAGELARTGGHYEDVYVRTPAGWRFRKRDFIPSKSGADPAPLPPPRIPANATPPESSGAIRPETPFVAPTLQSSLSALDYLEIAQLVSSYGHALDSGYGKGENGEAYARLYTPDAAFAGAEGHDQLVTLAQIQPRGPDFVRHYLTNHVIEPTAGGAKGKEYLVVIDNGENGKPSSLFLGGHYEDTYVKTPEGWRIKTRRLLPPRSGPQPPAQPSAAVSAASTATVVGRNALTLQPTDYIEIQQLIARSAYAFDTAEKHGETYAQLFTSDGRFVANTAHPYEITGRAQLAAYAAGDLTHRGPAYVRDFATNYIVRSSAESATGRVYVVWIEVGENGNPGVIQSGGHYDDTYVKTRGAWKIKTRTFVPSKLGGRDVYDAKRVQ
jgi:hypothetical protein